MKKTAGIKKAASAKPRVNDVAPLIAEVRSLIHSARHAAASTVNTLQVLTNFEIGRRIVEHEQQGVERAAYGAEVLKALSTDLTAEFGGGYSLTNLKLMRKSYFEYHDRIGQTVSDQFGIAHVPDTAAAQNRQIGQTPSDQSPLAPISQTAPSKSNALSPERPRPPFPLSWSHYVLLLSISNPDERSFYEIEADRENWSLRELKRQLASSLYERLALSRDKAQVRRLAAEGHLVATPAVILKDPYVLEFLGLDER